MNHLPYSEIYPILASLPLFKGMEGQDLAFVNERVKMRILKVEKGETFISQDEPCLHLVFLLEGKIRVTKTSSAENYQITEWTEGKQVIEPEHLFGLNQRYGRQYTAETECGILLISKEAIRRVLLHNDIWRLNLINLLCTKVQHQEENIQKYGASSLEELIKSFAQERSLTKGTSRLILNMKMEDLGKYVNASRRSISQALHKMQVNGDVCLDRGTIIFNQGNYIKK